jgi:hypothetical protein
MAVQTHEILEIIRHQHFGLLAVCRDLRSEHGARIYKKLYVTSGGMMVAMDSEDLGDLSRTELAQFDAPQAAPNSPASAAGLKQWGEGMEVRTEDPTTGPAQPASAPAQSTEGANLQAQLVALTRRVEESAVDQGELADLREQLEAAQREAAEARSEAAAARAVATQVAERGAPNGGDGEKDAEEPKREVVGAGAGAGGRGGRARAKA